MTARTVKIIAAIWDLKEDVLHGGGLQPEFDAGMLEGALAILKANVDTDHELMQAEIQRQVEHRLLWALQHSASPGLAPSPPPTADRKGEGRMREQFAAWVIDSPAWFWFSLPVSVSAWAIETERYERLTRLLGAHALPQERT